MKHPQAFLASYLLLSSLTIYAADVEIPDVATPGHDGYLSGELIYALKNKPTPQCHASTIVETPNGLVAAWFGGSREKNPDVGIWISRKVEREWTKPAEVADGSEGKSQDYACWNPVLFQPQAGPLMLFYKVGVNPRLWWGMLMTSTDHGKTWSQPRKLGQNKALGNGNNNLIGPVKNKPVQLANGNILCPSSTEHDGWRIHFELSRDKGQTWQVIGPINDASKFNVIQPSILQYPHKQMQILCRSREGNIVECWSTDGGATWGAMAATALPNPNAGTDAVTLADGRQLLVYNHTTRRGNFPTGRNMLNVALSKDGHMWWPVLTLEKQQGEFSYPAVIQARDNKIHISYTWKRQSIKHVVLDPDDLK